MFFLYYIDNEKTGLFVCHGALKFVLYTRQAFYIFIWYYSKFLLHLKFLWSNFLRIFFAIKKIWERKRKRVVEQMKNNHRKRKFIFIFFCDISFFSLMFILKVKTVKQKTEKMLSKKNLKIFRWYEWKSI